MREILFRGKRRDNRKWVEGYYAHFERAKNHCIYYSYKGAPLVTSIDPETVCQCTGLADRNGRKIFEGDILKLTYDDEESLYVVFWDEEDVMWRIQATDVRSADDMSCWDSAEWEVIGNIFDNLELVSG